MPKIINFEQMNREQYSHLNEGGLCKVEIPTNPTMNQTLGDSSIKESLQKSYPGKMLFSIQDVSNITSTSYEFIRKRVQTGTISSSGMGDRKLVHLDELTRVLLMGVK